MIPAYGFENMGRTAESVNSLPPTHPRRLTVNTLPIPKNIARLPYEVRLDYYISRLLCEPGCWLWIGAVDSHGYGKIKHNKRELKAHRAVYELYRSQIPAHLDACHHCDTPACVNPDHIFIGTAKDNAQDAVKKGRYFRPQKAGMVRCAKGHEYIAGKGCRECWNHTRNARRATRG